MQSQPAGTGTGLYPGMEGTEKHRERFPVLEYKLSWNDGKDSIGAPEWGLNKIMGRGPVAWNTDSDG